MGALATVVIGGGMGGLCAAIALARRGRRVVLLEARPELGGLASGVTAGGFEFDGGPYILLDRPGLERAFEQLGLDLTERIGELVCLDPVWTVEHHALDEPLVIHAELERTAADFERRWPGSGVRYTRFVERMGAHEARLRHMLEKDRPRPWHLVSSSAMLSAPLLLSSVGGVLRGADLPEPLVDALGIWTHVAGQDLDRAPAPLCFVPAIVHRKGAFVPKDGIRAIPTALGRAATELGVELRLGVAVERIVTHLGRVTAVRTRAGETIEADSVVSNVGALATYLELVDVAPPARFATFMQGLPLQSPGTTIYMLARRRADNEHRYLRFRLPGGGELCRLLVDSSVLSTDRDRTALLRLIAPMRRASAEAMASEAQRELAERLVSEAWWRDDYDEIRVVHTRTPLGWGDDFSLHRNAMNPTMTAAFMRRGRFAHRAPHVRGLYLAGSSTHPGQWVSFCALSGCIAAKTLEQDSA